MSANSSQSHPGRERRNTVFEISFDQANAAIKAAHATPAGFSFTDPTTKIVLTVQWSDWRLSGGVGPSLVIVCPVLSGTAAVEGQDFDLAGGALTIRILLQLLPEPSEVVVGGPPLEAPTFISGSSAGPAPYALKLAATDPAVIVATCSFPKVQGPLIPDVVAQLVARRLNAHLSDFDPLFAVLLAGPRAVTGGGEQ